MQKNHFWNASVVLIMVYFIIHCISKKSDRKRGAFLINTWLPDYQHYQTADSIPLTQTEETETIRMMLEEGSETARNTLIEHNLRLVLYKAGKFRNSAFEMEELISAGTIGLIKSVDSFRSDCQSTFATYASRCIQNEILMYIRKNKYEIRKLPLEDNEGNLIHDPAWPGDILEEACEKEKYKILFQEIEKLPSMEQAFIRRRYGLGNPDDKKMTQEEAALMLGISQPSVSKREKKILLKLRRDIMKALDL